MDYLIINANKVFLRPLTYRDAKTLFSYRSKPEVVKFQLWKPVEISDAASFIKKASFEIELINHQWNQFEICLNINNEMIGDIGLLLIDSIAEIGFTIDPRFQRRGLAFDAVTSLLKYLFKKNIVDVIIAYTDPKNIPSINLLKKIGFLLDYSKIDETKENSDLCFILTQDKN